MVTIGTFTFESRLRKNQRIMSAVADDIVRPGGSILKNICLSDESTLLKTRSKPGSVRSGGGRCILTTASPAAAWASRRANWAFDHGLTNVPVKPYIICAFYTDGYVRRSSPLEASLKAHGIPTCCAVSRLLGCGRRTRGSSPGSCVTAWLWHPGKDVVYIDADAVVRAP